MKCDTSTARSATATEKGRMASRGPTTRLNTYEATTKNPLRNGQTAVRSVRSVRTRETPKQPLMSSRYDERINDPALALMALGIHFCLLGVRWAYGPLAFTGALVGGKMYQHRHICRRLLSFSFGGTEYCHGVGNIPVEASGST